MHVHASFVTVLITLMEFIVTIGILNVWARQSGSNLAKGWTQIASPVG